MSKTRSCRRTQDEKQIHEQAVKIRRMTDEQIVKEISQAEKSGYDRAMKTTKYRTDVMLEKLEDVRGIGAVTLKRITQCCEEVGLC